MPQLLGEYTTVSDIKNTGYLDIQTAADPTLLGIVRSTSRDVDSLTNRHFFPVIKVRGYNCPTRFQWPSSDWLPQWKGGGINSMRLNLDDDLLEVMALTNGDGTLVLATKYVTWPYSDYPKLRIDLLPSGGVWWQPSAAGEFLNVIELSGVWGHHEDYTRAWVDTGATVTTVGLTPTGTTAAVATGTLKAGYLLKLGTVNDFAYCSDVTAGTPNDTLTLVRGVNGSIATTHTQGETLAYWRVSDDLEMLARTASAAKYKLRANPTQDTVMVAGMTFSTPKDIHKYLEAGVDALGLSKPGWG